MKRQLIRLAAVGAVAAGMIFAQAPAPAQAQKTAPNAAKPAMNHRVEARHNMLQALNLTAAQKEHAKAIFQQARDTNKPVREQLRQNRAAMTAAVKADNHVRIAQLSAERGKLMGQMTTARTEAMARFYQELTPPQRAKADRMHRQFQARMRTRMQHRAIGSNS